jgi:DNA mismatch repair protein MutS2
VLLGVVNEKALSELGWRSLCAELAQRARTPMGKERCRSLVPGDSEEDAARRLARVEEARELRRLDREVPLADALDMRAALGRAAREGTLEPQELLAIARLIRAAVSARRFCLVQKESVPLHADLAETLSDFEPLAQELERAFDLAGKLLDTASPLLAELRERSRGLHRGIKARLEEMLEDKEIVGMLRDAYYSVRGDRYVIPLRAEHKAHLPGIVHNASGSGQTLFVEPQELMELGNQLTIADASALEEEQRILGELSSAVGRRAEALARDVETLATLDEALAGARLADDIGASPPKLGNATTESFRLFAARHPLLVLQVNARGKSGSVIANDVELPPPARALVVSGPNAGGKTVTITAVGLSALMARAGLPVAAAEGSRMPLSRTVYTAIGDEGDLSRDLSTFTAHLTALRHILEAAGPGTLVLIDEIAADTDPREGAAIAVACLEKLVGAGAQVLITTHLEELKALALSDERFASASVGFDVDKLAPTYLLRMGEVGRSSAIEIAARVGLPADVCARAKEILGGGSSALNSALERLEVERAAAARARAEAEALRKTLAEERAAVQAEVEALRAAEREVRAGARAELVEDLSRRRQQIAEMVAQLQAAPALARAVEAQQQVARLEADEEREAAREQVRAVEAEAPPAGVRIRAGVAVRHARLGVEGVVIEADDDSDQVLVQMGALRTKVAKEDLIPLSRKSKGTAPGFRKTAREKLARAEAARAAPATTTVRPLDVRGLRVDEALRALEEELDRRLREGADEVQVLHGHGSGALKAAIREHLARSPYVRRARAGASHEGGDGVTVAELRG